MGLFYAKDCFIRMEKELKYTYCHVPPYFVHDLKTVAKTIEKIHQILQLQMSSYEIRNDI